MPIIEVDHVTKEFHLGQFRSFKQTALNGLRRLSGQPVEARKPFKALDDVSFTVEQGEVLGIIGHNGAGKSTLLKLLANISKPTTGSVKVRGRVAPLIEVGAGLIGDLTGRENIFLNATILGMKKAEIKRRLDEIVAFAELEEFIDTPIKRYSSGMHVRLGFSIATAVQSDILIVDEVLAVGDLAFQRKCFDRMEDLIKRHGNTVLLVSHNIRQIERLCVRTVLLDHGRIAADGAPMTVCDDFYARANTAIAHSVGVRNSRETRRESHPEFELLGIELHNESGTKIKEVVSGSNLTVALHVRSKDALSGLTFGLGVHTTDFFYLTTHSSELEAKRFNLPSGDTTLLCTVRKLPLLPGVFQFRLGVSSRSGAPIFYGENLQELRVVSPTGYPVPASMREGVFLIDASWQVQAVAEVERMVL